MTREEVAERLGLSTREVTAVREHPAGHVATLSAGRPEMLLTETVARAYVPAVDDPDGEDEAVPEKATEKAEPESKTPPRKGR